MGFAECCDVGVVLWDLRSVVVCAECCDVGVVL